MSKQTPTKTQKWLANLSWLGGAEGAALVALILGFHFVVARLIELVRGR